MNRIMKKAALLAAGICLILSSAAGTVFFGPAQEAQAKTFLHKIPAKGKTTKTKDEDGWDSPAEIKAAKEEKLSKAELAALDEELGVYLNGFFQCTYRIPEEIDWDEVLYNGGGLEQAEGREITAAYEEMTGEELMTGLTSLYREDVEDYVREWTGTAYYDAWYPLDWVWLGEQDVFCFAHGDTNFTPVKFTEGTSDGKTFRLKYYGHNFLFEDTEYTAVVEKHGNTWHFVSNLPSDWDGTEPVAGRYGSIFRRYLRALRLEADYSQLEKKGLSPLCLSLYDSWSDKGLSGAADLLGYVLQDLDGDKEEELLLGPAEDGGTIWQIYTFKDGRPSLVFDGSLYGSAALDEEGAVLIEAKEDFYTWSNSRCVLDPDTKELVTETGVLQQAGSGDENVYFEITGFDGTDYLLDEITEKRYEKITGTFEPVSLFYSPLPVSLEKTETAQDKAGGSVAGGPGQEDKNAKNLRALTYGEPFGKSCPDQSSYERDDGYFVDTYEYDGCVTVQLGRLVPVENEQEMLEVAEINGAVNGSVSCRKLESYQASRITGNDNLPVYELTYTTGEKSGRAFCRDLCIREDAALHWFHTEIPAGYYAEYVDELSYWKRHLTLGSWDGKDPVGAHSGENLKHRNAYIKLVDYDKGTGVCHLSVQDVSFVTDFDTELIEFYELPEDLDGYDYEIESQKGPARPRTTDRKAQYTILLTDEYGSPRGKEKTDAKAFSEALREKKSMYVQYVFDLDKFVMTGISEEYIP